MRASKHENASKQARKVRASKQRKCEQADKKTAREQAGKMRTSKQLIASTQAGEEQACEFLKLD